MGCNRLVNIVSKGYKSIPNRIYGYIITKKYKMSSFLSFQQVFDNILTKMTEMIM